MISIDWDRWWLGKLPNHLPLLLASALAFHLGTLLFSWAFARLPSNTTSSVATTRAHGNSDKNDPQFRRMQWGISAVSFIHALVVGWMALNVYRDTSLRSDRLFGYTQAAGDLYAISCGYFLWDTAISIRYIQHYGIGFVLHAALSLLVYLFAFGPFLMWYGAVFLMFEWSTVFLYINWFLDKFGLTGSVYQIINGIVLLLVFFLVRIWWGLQMSFQFYQDVLFSVSSPRIPVWHKLLYCTANVFLMSLNIIWFRKLIWSLLKRINGRTASTTKKSD